MLTMLRTNRDIRSLFIAQVISYGGDWFAYVAFVGLVQDLTDSPILVTLVYVAQSLPAFLMSPIAGPVADRFDRRRIIQIVSVLQALAAIGLLAVGSAGTLWFGFVCLCLISGLGSFVGPSAQAGLPNLVRGPEELKQASLLFGSLWGAMLAVGAAAGGLFASVFPAIGDAVCDGTRECGRGSKRKAGRSNKYPAICSAVSPIPPPLSLRSMISASALLTVAIARRAVSSHVDGSMKPSSFR